MLDKVFLQSKQSLLEEREEIRLTLAAKVTRKTQKLTLVNKETEAATNDKRVHSSRSEYTAVRECGKRTKMTHATYVQLNLGLHVDHAAVLRLCTGVDWHH